MIIIGAGGFAKELLELVYKQYGQKDICFFDDYTIAGPALLYDKFPIITSLREADNYFKKNDPQFVLGLGNPHNRFDLYKKFLAIDGVPISIISNDAMIGNFGTTISEAVTIMQGVKITNSIHIGEGCLINLNCTIGYDSRMGVFCELSPGVHISGHCEIGDFCNIGTNAVLLPGVKLGDNVIVGAGAVVNKNVPDNVTVVGIPARPVTKKNG